MPTFKSKVAAERDARKILPLMRNPRAWTVCVWENLGWHWSLQCRNVNLNASDYEGRTYSCLISDEEGSVGGLACWTPRDDDCSDPQDAVDVAVQAARDYVARMQSLVIMAEDAIRIPSTRKKK